MEKDMARELPKRNEVKQEDTWNLSDMYDSVEAWDADFDVIISLTNDIIALEGRVGDSPENLYQALECFSEIEEISSRLFNYADRLYDEDTSNTEHQAMSAKIHTVYAEIGGKLAFLDPEILAISEDTLEEYYVLFPKLQLYKKYVEELKRLQDHLLSADMEKLIAHTAQMRQTASHTYSVLNNADLIFPEVEDEKGEQIRITNGRFVRLLESKDPVVRKNTFEKYYSVYKQFLNTFASLYDGQVKQQIFIAEARKYNSSLECSVHQNQVPSLVYHNLIDTVNHNMDKLHRYIRLRKKWLGLKELHMYDIYTPMVSGIAKTYSFEDAKAIALHALAPLGSEYIAKVKEGFEHRWIDIYENQGKRSGAYSAGAYGTHPYVLLNYQGSLDDVFTLVHEMGHAMHSYYSNENQPFLYSQYKIFVAEVASTCNEVLLLEYLLQNTSDLNERAYLLNHYLDMFKGTLYRQTQFAEYEMLTNEMVERGESLNAENLSALYMELNKKYYGPDIISDEEIAYEWARIPHFYYDFYVYQYATSFSAAVAIAHDILREGAPVVERYLTFLAGGCSKPPVELLKIVGVDMEQPKPIQDALDIMDEVLDEMEQFRTCP